MPLPSCAHSMRKGSRGTLSYFSMKLPRSVLHGTTSRSKKETERLHQLHKPVRKAVEDDLPSIHSHSEGEEEWSSGIDDMDSVSGEEEPMSSSDEEAPSTAGSSPHAQRKRRRKAADSDEEELPFEAQPRKRRMSWEPESDKEKGIERLPIKLADGRIQKSGNKVFLDDSEESGLDSDTESAGHQAQNVPQSKVEDVSTGARFGRPAVVDVIGQKSRKARIQGAKEQIAGICQDILGDPENSVRSQ